MGERVGRIENSEAFTDRFAKEDGFTTVGMAVAILVALALLFTAAQLYRIGSLSGDVQEVADAAALAAENEVGEFMVAVHLCDAVILSMTLLSLSLSALGIVTACVPPAASLSASLLDMGKKVMDARDSFAEKAQTGLNKLQAALPFLSAANAATVAAGNNGGVGGARYFATAFLVPEEGKEIEAGSSEEAREVQETADAEAEIIRERAKEAEELSEEARAQKERAFMADCGNAPGRCQYERAASLASLAAADNPQFSSADTWSFSMALERARAYYRARADQPISEAGDAETRADAVLRKRFYDYAVEQMASGYVRETEDSFEANFPLLFKNTSEMRESALYTEAAYPVTVAADGQHKTMHAWGGCPQAQGVIGLRSVSQLEAQADEFVRCDACEFRPSSLGNVAAASSAINTGFEYHYRIVAEAAREYQRITGELEPKKAEVEQRSDSLIGRFIDLMGSFANKRLTAEPPGRNGAIALVVNASSTPTNAGFESAFAVADRTLDARAAVAGATLVSDPAHDGSSVISSLLDGFGADGGVALGAGRIALDGWSNLLRSYGEGQRTLLSGIEDGLNNVPLLTEARLGTRAANKLREGIDGLGLQPARLDALKPVLVNTSYVAAAGSDPFAVRYRDVQARAREIASGSTDLFSSVVDTVRSHAYDELDKVAEGIRIAEVELPFIEQSVPITIPVPDGVINTLKSKVDACVDAVKSVYVSLTNVRVWS